MNPEDRKAMEMAREALQKTIGAWGGTCAWHADVKAALALLDERLQADEPKENPEPGSMSDAELLDTLCQARLANQSTMSSPRYAWELVRKVIAALGDRIYGPNSRSQADEPNSVKLPTSADEAELMAKVGLKWLEDNAPQRLKQADEKEEPDLRAAERAIYAYVEDYEPAEPMDRKDMLVDAMIGLLADDGFQAALRSREEKTAKS